MKLRSVIGPQTEWEQGGECHWSEELIGSQNDVLFPQPAALFASGRAALYGLLRLGQASSGWRRLWVPSYYDHDVITTIRRSGIELAIFADYPFAEPRCPQDLRPGDAILINNLFGLRRQQTYETFYTLGYPIIEDHSHDLGSPWAQQSRAAYVFATLRKTLPFPDGGFVWSPQGLELPPEPRGVSPAAFHKLEAMLLKTLYLRCGHPLKPVYLQLTEEGEDGFVEQLDYGISPISKALLPCFAWRAWRESRQQNYRRMRQLIKVAADRQVAAADEGDVCPFVLTLLCDSNKQREALRSELIRRRVYPPVLWPLTKTEATWPDAQAVDLSSRIMGLHYDGRYDEDDLQHLAKIFHESWDKIKPAGY